MTMMIKEKWKGQEKIVGSHGLVERNWPHSVIPTTLFSWFRPAKVKEKDMQDLPLRLILSVYTDFF